MVGGVAALSGAQVEVPQDTSLYGEVEQVAVRALTTLRHRNFRVYSIGVMCSFVGTWIESAAFGYVVLLLGGSAATLGLIGFLNTIPNLVFGLPAGTLADRYDRRRLLLVFQSLNLCVSAALAVLYATGSLTVTTMGALAVVGGSLGALSFPAFQGMLADTVPRPRPRKRRGRQQPVASGRALRRPGDRRVPARGRGAGVGVRSERASASSRSSWRSRCCRARGRSRPASRAGCEARWARRFATCSASGRSRR